MKRIYALLFLLLSLFALYLIILHTPKNYTIKYKYKDYEVKETYNKNSNYYLFEINYKELTYPVIVNKKYTSKRKLIKNIKSNILNNEICLDISIDKTHTICSDKKILKTINTMSSEYINKYYSKLIPTNNILDSYNKIEIYNYNKKYLIWNYKGLYQIFKNNTKQIEIFNKDNYKNNLSYQTDKYLLIADYDNDYYFNKLYYYDLKEEKLKTIVFDHDISFDSFFLGENNNKVYLLDKKNKQEYEINFKKSNIKIISKDGEGIIYDNNNLNKVSINKIINNNLTFKYKNTYNYILEDNTLYLIINNYKIKVSNNNIKSIIKQNGNEIYYITEDKLYVYDYFRESLLLKYPEWNFNYNNQIFIYD